MVRSITKEFYDGSLSNPYRNHNPRVAWVSFPANAAQQVGVGHCPRGDFEKCLLFCNGLPSDKHRGGTKARCLWACSKTVTNGEIGRGRAIDESAAYRVANIAKLPGLLTIKRRSARSSHTLRLLHAALSQTRLLEQVGHSKPHHVHAVIEIRHQKDVAAAQISPAALLRSNS